MMADGGLREVLNQSSVLVKTDICHEAVKLTEMMGTWLRVNDEVER